MARIFGKFFGAGFQEDTFTADGTTTAFTLSSTPASVKALVVAQNGLVQTYTTDYTVSGVTLTFVTAPVVGQTLMAKYIRAN